MHYVYLALGPIKRSKNVDPRLTLTPAQCKAARRLLGWSPGVLAHKVRLSEFDIARFEVGKPGMSFIGTAMIRRTFKVAGVGFDDERRVRLREGK
jgi:ribosome-binding protein aMBF1 (putative translation factor)